MPSVRPHPVLGDVLSYTEYGDFQDLVGREVLSGAYSFYPKAYSALVAHGGHDDLTLTSTAQVTLDADWVPWDTAPGTVPNGTVVFFICDNPNTQAVKITLDAAEVDNRNLQKATSAGLAALAAGDLLEDYLYCVVFISATVAVLLNPSSTLRPTFVDGEDLTSQIDDVTAAFTLANTPAPATSLHLYYNSRRLREGGGNDYTLSGATVTLAFVPVTGDTLIADYRM